jgi:outer membrane lipoprotein-sorting protein
MRHVLKAVLPIIAIGLFAGIFSVTEASAQGVLREILNRMDAHNKALTTLRSKVTMVKTQAQLGESDTMTGTLIYAKGKTREPLFRIDWEKPQESIAVKDGQYILYQPRLATAYTGSTKQAGNNSKASSAFAFMNMTKAELRANYDVVLKGENVTLSSGVKTWHLELVPKAKSSYKSAELWVDPDGMPHQTRIVERNNDTSTVLVTNLEKNVKLNSSNFQISIPSGTKIQKS